MTYLHKVKCMHCGLHFTAFTWEADWFPRGCPECKTQFDALGGYMHWLDQSSMQIYQFVPGNAVTPKTVDLELQGTHPNDK